MDKVRIGVLSHAHGHSNAYCRKMLEFDDVELVACWDDNEDRGREAAAGFGMEYSSAVTYTNMTLPHNREGFIAVVAG